jgi:hypothetical protein
MGISIFTLFKVAGDGKSLLSSAVLGLHSILNKGATSSGSGGIWHKKHRPLDIDKK